MRLVDYIKKYKEGGDERGIKKPENVSDEQWEIAMDIYNTAKSVGDKYPELTLAQAALETGWFQSPSGDFNYFGQKASKSQKGSSKTTHEYYEGNKEEIDDKFRDYNDLTEALKDRKRLWGSKYEDSPTVLDALGSIWQYNPETKSGTGYATDPKYGDKIKSILGTLGVDTKTPAYKTPPAVSSDLDGYTQTGVPRRTVTNAEIKTAANEFSKENDTTQESPSSAERYNQIQAEQESKKEETKTKTDLAKERLEQEQLKKQKLLSLLTQPETSNEQYNQQLASSTPQQVQPFRFQTDWYQPQFKEGGVLGKMIGKLKPQMQRGGKKEQTPTEVYYGTPEYEKAYNEGRLKDFENPLGEVVITVDGKTDKNILQDYPYYNELNGQEKEYFRDSSPIGAQIRARAADGKGFNANKARDLVTGMLTDLPLSSLQAPQSMMVEGVEALRGNKSDMLSALSPGEQRVPSGVWGYENPEGFLQNVSNIGMDIVLDPSNITGAGVAKSALKQGSRSGLKSIDNVVTAAKKTGDIKNLDLLFNFKDIKNTSEASVNAADNFIKKQGLPVTKPKSNFKSEVKWGKWNKEIPENKDLMKEYNAIEEQAKADGTWMKNPDGSEFKGTNPTEKDLIDNNIIGMSPEEVIKGQFIQSKSKHLKRAAPEGYTITHRGGDGINPNVINNPEYTAGFTSLNPNLASGYGKSKATLLSKNSENSITFDARNDVWSDLKFATDRKAEMQFNLEQHKKELKKLEETPVIEETKPQFETELEETFYMSPERRRRTSIESKKWEIKHLEEGIAKYKETAPDNDLFLKMKEHFKGKKDVSTDDIAKYIEENNLDNIRINNVDDGGRGDIVIGNHKKGNYLKSLIGNNGMFDMSNPNIYKTLVPAAIGVGAASQTKLAYGGMIGTGDGDKEKEAKTAETPVSSRPLVYAPVSIEKQRQKQVDWYNNPVTNSRLRDNLKSIGQDPAKATPLLSNAADNINNTSVHQDHSNNPHLEGSYKNNKINIYEAGRDNAEVLSHEFTHAGGVDKPLSAYIRKNYGSPFTNYRDRIAKEKGLNYNPETYMYEGGDKPMSGMELVRSNFDTNYGFDSEKSMMDYLNKPGQGELYPRFQEMRNFLNVQPGQEITEDHINTLKSDPKMKFMFKYYSPEKIKNILNTVASNQSQNNTNKYKGLV